MKHRVGNERAHAKPMKSGLPIQRVFGHTLRVHPKSIRMCSVCEKVNL